MNRKKRVLFLAESQEYSLQQLPQPTITAIAQRAGVSIATVSRVLNADAHVSSKTRQKVLRALHELEEGSERQGLIRPDGQSAPGNRHDLISLTALTMCHDEYPFILDGIVEGVHERNARLVICPLAGRHNQGQTLLERLLPGEARGGLVVGRTDSSEELLHVIEAGFPLVLIDPSAPLHDRIPTVTLAHWHAAKIATEHLISLGHRAIGIITLPKRLYVSDNRFAGFQSAMLAAGLTINSSWVVPVEETSTSEGYRAACCFFDQTPLPTAIIAFNDIIAPGVLQAAYDRGIKVPEQLSIIGCDDLSFAERMIPSLTTISQPFEEMGRVAVDMLYRIFTNPALKAARIELAGRLKQRATTAPPFLS